MFVYGFNCLNFLEITLILQELQRLENTGKTYRELLLEREVTVSRGGEKFDTAAQEENLPRSAM